MFAPNLKVISRMGVGFDTIDFVAATERGVAVIITVGANAHNIAEHTLALLMVLCRRTVIVYGKVRSGK